MDETGSGAASSPRSFGGGGGHLEATPAMECCSLSPPAAAALLLQSSPRDSYSPFDDIQQHLVRSPPPCIATLRSFTYEADGYRSGGDDDSCELCDAGDGEEEPDEDDVFRAGLRHLRNAPLPHVKQSCPMFRPLTSVQKVR
jgi:hypothetical protein